MNGLDLFSGIGGLSLALRPWVTPVAYCENDRFAQAVLLSRQRDGRLPRAAIWDDVRTFAGSVLNSLPGPIDIIYGGFPCQDISVAGNGKGLAGERSGLFYEIIRLTKECNPTFVFLENVPAIRTRGLGKVIREFTDLRYDCRWTCVSAAEVGAPHLRKRWFLLAHSRRESERNESGREQWSCGSEDSPEFGNYGQEKSLAVVANPEGFGRVEGRLSIGTPKTHTQLEFPSEMGHGDGVGLEKSWVERISRELGPTDTIARPSWWESEPSVGRVAHGVPHRVDRLRGLGNSVVPLQARTAFMRLMGINFKEEK